MTETMVQSESLTPRQQSPVWVPLGIGAGVVGLILSIFDKGWLPHDDGYLAWAARETLNGGMPHRDFHEVYTGGLSYLNAWAFGMFGESMLALRIPYLVFLVAFGVVLYLVARRFLSRNTSSVAVGAVIFLGPALTATPMPTLYNLFLGTFTLYLAFRFIETDQRFWLLAAGFVTGLSVIVKVTGLYVLLAIPLGLIAHHLSRRASGPDAISRLLLIGAAIVPTLLILNDFTLSRFVGLLVPIYIVVWCIWTVKTSTSADLASSDTPPNAGLVSILMFSIGAAVPIGLYGWLYAANDAAHDLLRGVTGSASAVVGEFSSDLADLRTLGIPLALAGVCFLVTRLSRGWNQVYVAGTIGGFLLFWYALAPRNELLVIHGFNRWISLAACVGLLLLVIKTDDRYRVVDSRLIMLGGVVACFQLVQFPSSNPWQVAYTVPLAGILLFALLARLERRAFVVAAALVVSFAIVFGLARHQGQLFASSETGARVRYVALQGAYGGIEIPIVHDHYNDVVEAVSARPHSETLMAGPDVPEIYFLTGKRGSYPGVFPILDKPIDPDYSMSGQFEASPSDMVVLDFDPPASELEDTWVMNVRERCELILVAGPLELYVECIDP